VLQAAEAYFVTPRIRLLLLPAICLVAAAASGATCTPTGANRTVTVCTPANGATVTSPFEVSAAATDSATVAAMQIYLDGVKIFSVAASSFDTTVTASVGTHRLTVKAWDSAGSFSQVLSITVSSGGGGGGSVSVSPTSLVFGNQTVGTTSAPQPVTLSNTTSNTVTISSISISGDFGQGNNCGSSVAANGSCTINVTFSPSTTGSRSGTLSIDDSAGTQTVSLVGTGGTSTSCSLSSANPSVTICQPANNANVTSPVQIIAGTTDSHTVIAMKIYVDGVSQFFTSSNAIDTSLPMSLGTHRITVKAWDNASPQQVFSQTINIGVVSGGGGGSGDLSSLKHIIFMIEENRSFDTYFGQLDHYRMLQGLAGGAVDGLPPEGTGACSQPGLAGYTGPASGCMPTNLQNNSYSQTITAFHLQTMCIENTSNAWFEAHVDFDLFSSASSTPTMDGFAWSAGGDAISKGTNDTIGQRAMGYYDGNDLIYHYFMATQFATSDRWFSPGPMETEPSKMYYVAATSHGHAHAPTSSVNIPTIFSLLQSAGISWKVYYAGTSNQPILNFFQPFATNFASHIQPIANYFSDLQNGTLPQVVMIEPAFSGGRDEHPGTGNNIQQGVAESASYINALMSSSAWQSSAFIVTFDEAGGLYDHVPSPTNVPNPDGIPPQDLFTGTPQDQPGDFTRTGFRVPLLVVSPFARKHYVSHSVTDGTAILHLIEARFGLPQLTKRDAWAIDMTEFFDFVNPPWMTPPTPPTQPQNGACYDGLP
jgi:phospholipase C